MIDYKNGIDIELSYPIIYNSYWYILSASISNGNLFTFFPIDKNSIQLQSIKDRSFMLMQSQSSNMAVQFYWSLFQSLTNLDNKFNSLIGVIWQNSSSQITVMYFNTTSSAFESTYAINFNSVFYIWYFGNYNTTLLYVWGVTVRGSNLK